MHLHTDMSALLPAVVDAVQAAGATLLQRFASVPVRPVDLASLRAAIDANDAAVQHTLRRALLAARPGSGWIDDEEAGGALPAGEWWIVDPVEGNINHVQGGSGWGVTATLVQDGEPVLAVVWEPLPARLSTATVRGGAYSNGVRMQVSAKAELGAALVGTGQARPGEEAAVHLRTAAAVQRMLGQALLVRMAVPSTFEIAEVASGRLDSFWQASQVRSGLAAGVLLVREAGGVVTDMRGQPWSFASDDIVLSTPGVHAALIQALSGVQP